MKDMVEIITKGDRETKKAGKLFAKALLAEKNKKHASVISLEGDLGSGKTTFTKGFAEGLDIKEVIQSPTFVIMKIYRHGGKRSGKGNKSDRSAKNFSYKNLIHIDAYRILPKDLSVLGWKEFVKDPHSIVFIEWGERLKKALPKNTIHIKFFHEKFSHIRRIQFSPYN